MSVSSRETDRREAQVYRGTARQGPSQNPIVRLLTDWDYMNRAVRYALHLPTPLDTEDRRVLEQIIFKHLSEIKVPRSLLFVGCDWYTRHYQQTYFKNWDFWSIDVSAKAAKFAGKNHVVDSIEALDQYFPADKFGVIICNGVYGFGLDSLEGCERAFTRCYERLVPGGELVFGWNDIPERNPIDLDQVMALKRFEPISFPPLNSVRYRTKTPYNHTYNFYKRPSAQ